VDIIKASIPLFFALIAVELLWSRATGRRVVRLNDSLSDLACGIISQLAGIFTKLFSIGIFIWVGQRWTLQHAFAWVPAWNDNSALAWVAVFVLVDFCYYWSHRKAHEVNLLWAGHVVHHQSEEYNLPVALRQSALHGLMAWIFYIPLALIGVPWQMYVTCNALNLVYQFWIHTRAVGRLGTITEAVMNTPSHHRVHHGVNPKYQDKNYAGVFIVFDKWFGTFQVEEEEPVYGITKPLKSWNPLWANVHVFWQIARDGWKARRWRDKLRIAFGRPGWLPAELGEIERPREVSVETFEKYDPPVPAPLAWYAFAQFGVALAGALLVLQHAEMIPMAISAVGAFFVTVTLAGVAGVFERAKWAVTLETARLVTMALLAAYVLVQGIGQIWPAYVAIVFSVVSLAVLRRHKGELTKLELAPMM
jgi:alkylglycerol monooxygenase